MVRIMKSFLGEAAGKMGDVVFRQMNGKTFASLRPDKYKPTKSAKLKMARKNFALATAFSKKVNSIPALKELWLNAKLPGKLSFNRIMKENRKAIVNGSLTPANTITPEGLFFSISSLSVQNNILHLTFNFPSDPAINFPVKLFIFFYFNEDKKSLFIHQHKIEEQSTGDNYSLSIPLNPEVKKVFLKYSAALLYLALAGLPFKKKVYWTSTIAKQL